MKNVAMTVEEGTLLPGTSLTMGLGPSATIGRAVFAALKGKITLRERGMAEGMND